MVKRSSIARFLPGLVVLGALFASIAYWPAQAVTGYQLDQERGVFSLAPVIEEAVPAVVNVKVKTIQRVATNPMLQDPFFRQFFERRGAPRQPRQRQAQSAGSGVIIDAKNGYILTNNHVVERADAVEVVLADEREFEAEVIGSDPGTDVALLKIEADNLSALPVGDSDDLLVGDLVIAIGNPFGIGQTVTSGIVSALGRHTGIIQGGYEDYIQTDASINPGNSGGALINSKGELVGLNNSILTGGSGGSVGIGFAIPSNIATLIKDQLVKFGEVRRGQIGVAIQNMKPDIAEALGLTGQSGAIISEVLEGSPAEKAGLKAGDVVVSVNGRRVDGSSDFRNRIGLTEKGKSVELAVYRDGERKTINVKVGEVASATQLSSEDAIPRLVGAGFGPIPDDHPQSDVEGVYVRDVDPGSPAWNYGLREGDIIIEANQKRVKSVAELEAAAKTKRRVLALRFLRGNSQVFLAQ